LLRWSAGITLIVPTAMNTKLQPLFDYLDRLTGRAPLEELQAVMNTLDIDCEDVAECIKFSSSHYARNLLRAGEWYHALVMCWKNGQRSPIHDHAQSSCGVRVLRGVATETLFEFTPHGHIKASFSRDHHPGSVCGSEDDDLHQISNLQDGDADLVTLHVYSPPLMHMGTYSITDLKRGVEPMYMEFSGGAGI
jgi:cysteine dioxygenase